MIERTDRLASAALAIVGILMLGSLVAIVVPLLPDLLGDDPHIAGDATMVVTFIGVPLATCGLVSLGSATLLWLGAPAGRLLALAWSVILGAGVVGVVAASGGYLWEPFGWLLPAIGVGVLVSAALVLAGWTADRREGAPRD